MAVDSYKEEEGEGGTGLFYKSSKLDLPITRTFIFIESCRNKLYRQYYSSTGRLQYFVFKFLINYKIINILFKLLEI